MGKIIIVGGGPLGLYAAGLLEEQGQDYLLLEAGEILGGQPESLYSEKQIVDIPGLSSIKAKDFVASLVSKIDKSKVRLNCQASSFKEDKDGVHVQTSLGDFSGDYLILATGLGFYKPRPLGVPNEEKYKNIIYSLKDFSFLKNKKVVIFGGGDSALDWAKEISFISPDVNLVHRRTEFRGNADTIKGRPVNLYLPYVPVSLIEKDGQCLGIKIENVENKKDVDLLVDYILVNFGSVPSPSLLGVKPAEGGFGAEVDEKRMASSRVYCIGDCCFLPSKPKRIAPGMEDARIVVDQIIKR